MNFNYFWCYLGLLLNCFSLPFYSESCDVFVHFVTYLQCLVCGNDGGGSISLLNNMYSEQWHYEKEIQMEGKKRILGFEDIQADSNTQQREAEVDTDMMQNSGSSQKKTISTQKQKRREGTKQAPLLYFSVGLERKHWRSQNHKTRQTRVIISRRYAQLEQQWKVVGGKQIQMSILWFVTRPRRQWACDWNGQIQQIHPRNQFLLHAVACISGVNNWFTNFPSLILMRVSDLLCFSFKTFGGFSGALFTLLLYPSV